MTQERKFREAKREMAGRPDWMRSDLNPIWEEYRYGSLSKRLEAARQLLRVSKERKAELERRMKQETRRIKSFQKNIERLMVVLGRKK